MWKLTGWGAKNGTQFIKIQTALPDGYDVFLCEAGAFGFKVKSLKFFWLIDDAREFVAELVEKYNKQTCAAVI